MLTTLAQVGVTGAHLAVVTVCKDYDPAGFTAIYPKVAGALIIAILALGLIDILVWKR